MGSASNETTAITETTFLTFPDIVDVIGAFQCLEILEFCTRPNDRSGCAPWKGDVFQWVKGPPGNSLQPEAAGAVMEVTTWLKPSECGLRIGDRASVQAVTQVNAEQASKRTMCRPTRQPFRGRLTRLDAREKTTSRRCTGVVAAACTQGKRTQHGKPHGVVRDDQPDAREGQVGRRGVAERFAVPLKPGNTGGGKGPQFKTDARRGEGPGDWATYQLRRVFRNCRWRYRRKRRLKPAIASTRCTTRSAVRIF